MKRYGNLFDKAFSRENLYQAYLDARKGKRTKRACFEFEKSLGHNLEMIHEEIHGGTYRPMPYFQFVVYEPKERIIHAPSFRDVVVQHAIYRVIYGIFDRSFIDTSFACRKKKGTHKAAAYTRRAMRKCSGDAYFLQLDIRKFFYSIDRAILRKQIERKIKDERLTDVMMLFADMDAAKGIPIGNLLSQIYALIFLNPLDHYIKRILHIKHYVRYVDDFLLVGITRDEAISMRERIVAFIRAKLGLVLSKSTIQRIRKGINFCGYRMWRSCLFIRKYSLFKFRKAVNAGKQEVINSILGHAKRTNSLKCMLTFIKEGITHGKDIEIPKSYRRIYNAHAC